VGIIGRNGAGKSTLLKLLARITRPTAGRFTLRGRVGSLLEVGAGFHPELTGRENVFLNGAILGMSRREIMAKFDRIVQFSGIEEFLDTPVKRYSSGMRVRLAFAVAAHLEPDVLIIDEVLAVGDADFQKKCLGKMDEVTRGGRTVLFVSHNTAAVSQLCNKGLVLSHGRSAFWGEADDAIRYYMMSAAAGSAARVDLRDAPRWPGFKQKVLTWAGLERPDAVAANEFSTGQSIIVRIGYRIDRAMKAYCQINVTDLLGERLLTIRSNHGGKVLDLPSGEGRLECRMDDIRLLSGEYTLSIEFGIQEGFANWLDFVPDALRMRVQLGSYLGGAEPVRTQARFAQRSQWEWQPCDGGPLDAC
jgi:lipopolysaccharide transport system ATP-binding protein